MDWSAEFLCSPCFFFHDSIILFLCFWVGTYTFFFISSVYKELLTFQCLVEFIMEISAPELLFPMGSCFCLFCFPESILKLVTDIHTFLSSYISCISFFLLCLSFVCSSFSKSLGHEDRVFVWVPYITIEAHKLIHFPIRIIYMITFDKYGLLWFTIISKYFLTFFCLLIRSFSPKCAVSYSFKLWFVF